jgi:hypothetical protein
MVGGSDVMIGERVCERGLRERLRSFDNIWRELWLKQLTSRVFRLWVLSAIDNMGGMGSCMVSDICSCRVLRKLRERIQRKTRLPQRSCATPLTERQSDPI